MVGGCREDKKKWKYGRISQRVQAVRLGINKCLQGYESKRCTE